MLILTKCKNIPILKPRALGRRPIRWVPKEGPRQPVAARRRFDVSRLESAFWAHLKSTFDSGPPKEGYCRMCSLPPEHDYNWLMCRSLGGRPLPYPHPYFPLSDGGRDMTCLRSRAPEAVFGGMKQGLQISSWSGSSSRLWNGGVLAATVETVGGSRVVIRHRFLQGIVGGEL